MLVHIPEQDAREYAVRVSGRAQAQLAAIYGGDVDDHPSPGEDGRFVVWLPGRSHEMKTPVGARAIQH